MTSVATGARVRCERHPAQLLTQNVRRGHYELAVEEPANRRLAVAFHVLGLVI